MIDRLAAGARGAEHDLEVLLQARLADELVEAARPQAGFQRVVLAALRPDKAIVRGLQLCHGLNTLRPRN